MYGKGKWREIIQVFTYNPVPFGCCLQHSDFQISMTWPEDRINSLCLCISLILAHVDLLLCHLV